MRPLGGALCCVVVLTMVAACSDTPPARAPRRQAIDSLLSQVMLPMLADFEDRTLELETKSEALCGPPRRAADPPRTDAIDDARDAWQDARQAFRRADVLAFGPHTVPPWRLGPQLDFWPVRVDDLVAVLADDAPLGSDDGGRVVLGASAKGLPAIEYLLYGDGVQQAELELGDFALDGRRCEYLRALGSDLHATASLLHTAWEDSFAADLTLAPGTERYMNIGEAFGEVVNGVAFTVEILRDEKLGRPLGLKSGGEAQPEAVESRFAERSIDDALDTLSGVESLLTGRYGDGQAIGLLEVVSRSNVPRGNALGAQARTRLDAARESLQAIDAPLDDAVVHDRAAVEHAREVLRELLVLLQVELTQALAVTVTFGGADGD